MIISCSEIEIILNELFAQNTKVITLSPIFMDEKIFNYDLQSKKLFLKTNPHSWRLVIDFLVSSYSLSSAGKKELPEFDDIIKAIVSAGLLMPEGIDVLINVIKNYLTPIQRMNRRKRILIALDTNQLVDNLMSSYIENEFSSKGQNEVRNFISYLISSWVLEERNGFMRNERNKGITDLNEKLKEWDYYLPEKMGRKARLGYSIYSELKSLEESYTQLESNKSSEEKYKIFKRSKICLFNL